MLAPDTCSAAAKITMPQGSYSVHQPHPAGHRRTTARAAGRHSAPAVVSNTSNVVGVVSLISHQLDSAVLLIVLPLLELPCLRAITPDGTLFSGLFGAPQQVLWALI